jgi:hypothetical protein
MLDAQVHAVHIFFLGLESAHVAFEVDVDEHVYGPCSAQHTRVLRHLRDGVPVHLRHPLLVTSRHPFVSIQHFLVGRAQLVDQSPYFLSAGDGRRVDRSDIGIAALVDEPLVVVQDADADER